MQICIVVYHYFSHVHVVSDFPLTQILRRDMDLLRDNLFRAEKVTQAAKKKLNVEKDGVNELLSKCRAADSIRQDAYTHMHSLKKQLYEQVHRFYIVFPSFVLVPLLIGYP